jgi:GntP family gluconate:H+ symporter
MGIIAGGTMAHSLVPPTPGPLLVADKLGVDLGTMMIAGSVVGVFTCVFGYAYAAWINRLRPIPIRDSDQESPAQTHPQTASEARNSPPLGVSLAPIVLPVVLITGAAVLQAVAAESLPTWFAWFFATFGERNLALMLAAALALGILAHYRRASKSELAAIVASALGSAGVIILITSAGGAFGGVLQDTGVSERIGALASDHQVALLPLAFFLTALIRTAQGSATVAMITTVGIVAGMTDTAGLGFHPVYLAMAIGCGSKPFPWMNDSGFWIISRMSGMTEGETLRSFSCMITLMALAGLALVILAAKLWPLV